MSDRRRVPFQVCIGDTQRAPGVLQDDNQGYVASAFPSVIAIAVPHNFDCAQRERGFAKKGCATVRLTAGLGCIVRRVTSRGQARLERSKSRPVDFLETNDVSLE